MGLVGRRRFLIAAGALLAHRLARAKTADRVYRLGYLVAFSHSATASPFAAFRRGLHELGYREGENLSIDIRSPDGHVERLPALAAELVALKPDVLFTGGTRAAFALKRATSKIPIVATAVGDALATGLVRSLARPEGNLTGFTFLIQDLYAKRLELLREAVPDLKRVAVLLDPTNAAIFTNIRKTETAAASMKLESLRFEVRNVRDLERVLAGVHAQGFDALFVTQSPLLTAGNKEIAVLALRHRLPSAGYIHYGRAGGLIGYGITNDVMFHRAASYVVRILEGARPGDLPMEQPTEFELVLNQSTARELGLGLPQSLLIRATEVIE